MKQRKYFFLNVLPVQFAECNYSRLSLSRQLPSRGLKLEVAYRQKLFSAREEQNHLVRRVVVSRVEKVGVFRVAYNKTFFSTSFAIDSNTAATNINFLGQRIT